MKHLLKMLDMSQEEIIDILNLADQLKYEKKNGIPHHILKGKTLGMIFEKSSTRTRVSFEVGMYDLGGMGLFLSSRDLQIGRGEPVEDTARVLDRYCDGIMIRTFAQKEVEDLPSGVYSINELRNTGINASADASCPSAEDIATIIFTSGTTGKSKGVMLTQNNLASNVEAVKISAEPGTAMLSVLPIHHAFCLVMDWLKGFSQGATICINDSLLHMVRNMSIFKPDIMLMVPMMIETIYKRLAAADPQIPKAVLAEKVFGEKLQTIFTGGAHLDPYYIDRFAEYGVQILEGYGMSECSPVISNNTPENHKPGSIGKPLENVEIRFENGEILVKGTSVMKGYYQMPDETAETLKDGWLHTGDKGYMDEDGYLFINGRVKNLIILSNGENVSPEEIENKLALNPLVGEVIVTGEDNGLTARIYPEQAVVEAKALDTEMIRSQLQEFLDEYNKNQPTYRRITGLVIRKNPFIRSTTKKIRRQDVLIDEPQA